METKGAGKAQVKLRIYGRVQGVAFRLGVVERARELGLSGWVRNREDGTVELIAEGDRRALRRLYQWCQGGTSSSKVEKVEVEQRPYQNEFNSFEIRY